MTGPDQERLACGRSVEETLGQVAEGRGTERDAHQQSCPYCQASLAEYERLWAPMRELADQQVSAPDGVLGSALTLIRQLVEHSDYGVIESDRGVTRIAARVVVVAARQTAQGVDGVRVAVSKHLAADRDGGGERVTAGVAGRSAAIEITLAADYGQDLDALGERVRREVAAHIRTLTDLDPVWISVVIDEVLEPGPPEA